MRGREGRGREKTLPRRGEGGRRWRLAGRSGPGWETGELRRGSSVGGSSSPLSAARANLRRWDCNHGSASHVGVVEKNSVEEMVRLAPGREWGRLGGRPVEGRLPHRCPLSFAFWPVGDRGGEEDHLVSVGTRYGIKNWGNSGVKPLPVPGFHGGQGAETLLTSTPYIRRCRD